MIVYRGWGPFFIIAFPALGLIGGQRLLGADNPLGIRLGFLVGTLVGLAFAWWLNVIRPKQQLERFRETRSQELQASVQSGQFALPDAPPPSSWAEADQQASQYLDEEAKAVYRQARNHHTLFFIPVQWLSFVMLGVAIFALFSLVTGSG